MPSRPVFAVLLVVLAACGDSGGPEPVAAEPIPVVAVVEDGGCAMMGPNCMTALVWSDGTVHLHRSRALSGPDPISALVAAEPELVLAVPSAPIDAFRETVAAADLERLRARLGPGTCNACVDGIDLTVHAATASGVVTFSSAQVRFEPSEPFFVALGDVWQTVRAAGSLPLLQR